MEHKLERIACCLCLPILCLLIRIGLFEITVFQACTCSQRFDLTQVSDPCCCALGAVCGSFCCRRATRVRSSCSRWMFFKTCPIPRCDFVFLCAVVSEVYLERCCPVDLTSLNCFGHSHFASAFGHELVDPKRRTRSFMEKGFM